MADAQNSESLVEKIQKTVKRTYKKRAKAAVVSSDGRYEPRPHIQVNGNLPVERHINV